MPFYGLLENALFFWNPHTDIFNLNYLNCAKMTVTSQSFTRQRDTRPVSNPLTSTVDDRVSEYKTRLKLLLLLIPFIKQQHCFTKSYKVGCTAAALLWWKRKYKQIFIWLEQLFLSKSSWKHQCPYMTFPPLLSPKMLQPSLNRACH